MGGVGKSSLSDTNQECKNLPAFIAQREPGNRSSFCYHYITLHCVSRRMDSCVNWVHFTFAKIPTQTRGAKEFRDCNPTPENQAAWSKRVKNSNHPSPGPRYGLRPVVSGPAERSLSSGSASALTEGWRGSAGRVATDCSLGLTREWPRRPGCTACRPGKVVCRDWKPLRPRGDAGETRFLTAIH